MQPIQSKFLAFRIFHARDAEAYRQLYREYRSKIHRFLAMKLPRHEDADEAASEVFLRGWGIHDRKQSRVSTGTVLQDCTERPCWVFTSNANDTRKRY